MRKPKTVLTSLFLLFILTFVLLGKAHYKQIQGQLVAPVQVRQRVFFLHSVHWSVRLLMTPAEQSSAAGPLSSPG